MRTATRFNRNRITAAARGGMLLCAAFCLFAAPLARAQTYDFQVPSMSVRVQINQDSSSDFWYSIDFRNTSTSQPIDVLDIGMPHGGYNLQECSAAINGAPLTRIAPSTVVNPGVEVHLDERSIPPGGGGNFQFHGKSPRMVYSDTESKGYASFQFMTTWWDGRYAHGDMDLTFQIVFPPGVKPNETKYHKTRFTSAGEYGGQLVFTWVRLDVSPSKGYLYGVSFPAVYVTGVYPKQPPPDYRPVSTSGYNYSYSNWYYRNIWIYIAIPALIVCARFFMSFFRLRRRGGKVSYLKPSLGIEGAGPMVDLWPAEAAVVMGQDLDRVAAVAFFEMLSKGLISITSTKPLVLASSGGGAQGPTYYKYFLGAVSPNGSLESSGLKLALTALIKDTEKRMQGRSTAETQAHYREAASLAWLQVMEVTDPAAKMEAFVRALPALILDQGFSARLRDLFAAGSYPVQPWMLGLVGAEASATMAVAGGGLSADGRGISEALANGFTALQDGSLVHVQDFQSQIVKEVNPEEYRRVYRPYWGRYYGGGGGGGGCACACACAGCACACAGGGR